METEQTLVTAGQAADVARELLARTNGMRITRPEFLAGLLLTYAVTVMPDGTPDQHVNWMTKATQELNLVTRLIWGTAQGKVS